MGSADYVLSINTAPAVVDLNGKAREHARQ